MIFEKKNTADLLPADYNPRKDLKPGDAEYEKLKRSIEQFGYVEPVIWNKTTGRVVGGHQRLKVLMAKGFLSSTSRPVDRFVLLLISLLTTVCTTSIKRGAPCSAMR